MKEKKERGQIKRTREKGETNRKRMEIKVKRAREDSVVNIDVSQKREKYSF